MVTLWNSRGVKKSPPTGVLSHGTYFFYFFFQVGAGSGVANQVRAGGGVENQVRAGGGVENQ